MYLPNFRYLISVFLLLQVMSCSDQQPASPPPNIIYILADDLGYGELGTYGQEKIETPHIDALAAGGMRFTQHYSGSPVCAPSRAVLLTGRHTGNAYIRGNNEWTERGDVWNFEAMLADSSLEGQWPLPDSIQTLAELLQDNGYRTALVGKWGLGAPGSEGAPNQQGFDFFFGYNCQRQAHSLSPTHLWQNDRRVMLQNELIPPHQGFPEGADPQDAAQYLRYKPRDYAPEVMHTAALDFIDKNSDQPFFMLYASPIPHVPLQAPDRWVKHYQQKFGPEKPYSGRSYFPNYTPRATYAAMISYLDEQVGELVAALKKQGVYENTLIIFTSDNGPTYAGGADTPFFDSANPFRTEYGWAKGFFHEGGIRVPMIASWPEKIQAGSESHHISVFYDVFPTLCDVAGITAPAGLDGISFLPTLLSRPNQASHSFLYWEFPSYKGQQAVRMGKWKGIRKNIFDGNLKLALYDLEKDIREENDIADQYPQIVVQIEDIMRREHAQAEVEQFRMTQLGDE